MLAVSKKATARLGKAAGEIFFVWFCVACDKETRHYNTNTGCTQCSKTAREQNYARYRSTLDEVAIDRGHEDTGTSYAHAVSIRSARGSVGHKRASDINREAHEERNTKRPRAMCNACNAVTHHYENGRCVCCKSRHDKKNRDRRLALPPEAWPMCSVCKTRRVGDASSSRCNDCSCAYTHVFNDDKLAIAIGRATAENRVTTRISRVRELSSILQTAASCSASKLVFRENEPNKLLCKSIDRVDQTQDHGPSNTQVVALAYNRLKNKAPDGMAREFLAGISLDALANGAKPAPRMCIEACCSALDSAKIAVRSFATRRALSAIEADRNQAKLALTTKGVELPSGRRERLEFLHAHLEKEVYNMPLKTWRNELKALLIVTTKCSMTDEALVEGHVLRSPSIDRIDFAGYHSPGNIQVVCVAYNLMKNKYDDVTALEALRVMRGSLQS